MPDLTDAATSKFARIQDQGLALNIHYNDAGAGDVVVMLHGSGPGASGWSNFSRNIGPFVDAGYRVLLVDCPGWNKSDTIVCAESRPHFNARILHALLDELSISRAHIVGNSMGGVSALDFALSYPERLDKMVIIGGGGVGPSLFNPLPMEGIKQITNLYANPTIDNLKRMLDIFVYDPTQISEELIQARFENMMSRPEHLENFIKSWRAHPKYPDFSPRLGEIAAPTLITWGRDDRFVALDLGLRTLWGLQQAELHVFSKCGHWTQWEHAARFNSLALGFLKG